jgi:hypothetical protein
MTTTQDIVARLWNLCHVLTFPYRDFSEYACGLADGTP